MGQLTKPEYQERIIDRQVKEYLNIFGAVTIEGPKWCGKTWTSLNNAKSVCFISDPEGNFQNRAKAELNPNLVLEGLRPRLIDEWQEVPPLWDAIRFEVDKTGESGQFLLTGSTTPNHKGILHSGAGRFGLLRMRTMSLFETKDSTGIVKLESLLDKKIVSQNVKQLSLEDIIYFCIRGGWPQLIGKSLTSATKLANSYLQTIISHDMFCLDKVKRDKRRVNYPSPKGDRACNCPVVRSTFLMSPTFKFQ